MTPHARMLFVTFLALTVNATSFAKTSAHPSSHAVRPSYVGVAAARRSATKSVPGHVLSTKLENEDGKMQYAVMVRDSKSMHEVMVDAHTGRVVSQEKVTAAEEARESAEETKAKHAKSSNRKR